MKCGGTGSSQPADEDTQQVIESVKQAVEEKLGRALATYKAIEVAKQMVAGMNYYVKVDIGDDNYIHVRVYKKLPCYGSTTELSGMQANKSKSDAVGFFEGFTL